MIGSKEAVAYFAAFVLVLNLDRIKGFYVQPEVPEFKVHPSSHLLLSNTSVNLTCSLQLQNSTANVPHPQIQWLVNGTPIAQILPDGWKVSSNGDSVLLTSRLLLPRLSPRHNGHYQCLARDGTVGGALCDGDEPIPCVGSHVMSGRGWIKIITDEPVEPELRRISVPGSILLECGSQIIEPIRRLIQVDWMKDGREITNSTNAFQLSSGDIAVHESETRDIRLECYVTMDTKRVIYRAYNVVSINDPTEVEETLLRVFIFVTSVILSRGSSVQMACLVSSDGNSSSNVTWFRRSDSRLDLPERTALQLDDHVLILNQLDTDGSGMYCCEVGGAEACTDIEIIDEVTRANPAQQFINFRYNRSHCVNMSCHIPHSLGPVFWFRNGNAVEDVTRHDLTRCSDDPYQLYGVYQCTAGADGEYSDLLGGDMGVVSRVLPYGITNPVGELSVMELPQPSPIQAGVYSTVLLRWSPPTYRGNVSSITYRIALESEGITYNSSEEMQQLYVRNFGQLFVQVFVHHEELGDVSSPASLYESIDSECNTYTLFPPQLLNISCLSGFVQVNFTFDSGSNSFSSFTMFDDSPKNYFFIGNCTYLQTTYEIQYEREETSPYTVGRDMIFEPGTRCTLAAANTPVPMGLQSIPDSCVDVRYLLYSDFISCSVYATVGFTSISRHVLLSSGKFEVCVESKGSGFNITVTSNSSAFLDFETELQFNISGASPSTTQCVNVSIPDNGNPGSTEVVALSILSPNTFVNIERNVTIVTIVNDAVLVMFETYTATVSESAGSVNICVVIETVPTRQRSISVQLHGSGDGIGDSDAMQEVTFASESMPIQCIRMDVMDDNVLSTDKIWMFYLSSNDFLVRVNSSPSVITIVDDDKVYIDLIQQSHYLDCNGFCNICLNNTGTLNKTINSTLTIKSELKVKTSYLVLNDVPRIHCFELSMEERGGNQIRDPFKVSFQLENSKGIIMHTNETWISLEKNCNARVYMIAVLTVAVLFFCFAGSICVAVVVVAIQKKRARNKYQRFQKDPMKSFDTHGGMAEDNIVFTNIEMTRNKTDMDDDNLSLIVSLEPSFKDASKPVSPDISIFEMLDNAENFEHSGERYDEDSGGYINHLDETDDKHFLLPLRNNELSFKEREVSTGSGSDVLESVDGSSNSSRNSMLDEANQNIFVNSGFPSNFSEPSLTNRSTSNDFISSNASVRSDVEETDDSGYPRNTLHSNQDEFQYDGVSVT